MQHLIEILKILLIVQWSYLLLLIIIFNTGIYAKHLTKLSEKLLREPNKLKKVEKSYNALKNRKTETIISMGFIIICLLIIWVLEKLGVVNMVDITPNFSLLVILAVVPIYIIFFVLEVYFKNILDRVKIG